MSGDQFQAGVCASGVDGCTGTTNSDYDARGYFYTLHVAKPVSNLQIELFDPALIDVGDLCDNSFIRTATPLPTTAENSFVSWASAATLYAPGATAAQKYCTGDIRFGGTGQVKTRFQVRSPSATPWDPMTFLPLAGCTKDYAGFSGNLFPVLDQYTTRHDAQGHLQPDRSPRTSAAG